MIRRLAAAALALLTLSGCSQPGQAAAANDGGCIDVPRDLLDQIAVGTEAGLRFSPSKGTAVRARKDVYVVAVRFHGVRKKAEVGVWTATGLRGIGAPLLVADEVAAAYTTWSTVEEFPQFGVPLDSPLIATARSCLT